MASRAARLSKLRGNLLSRPQPKDLTQRCVLLRDPAIERWGKMRETTDEHFKFTPKTVFLGSIVVGLIPYGIFQLVMIDVKKKKYSLHGDMGYLGA